MHSCTRAHAALHAHCVAALFMGRLQLHISAETKILCAVYSDSHPGQQVPQLIDLKKRIASICDDLALLANPVREWTQSTQDGWHENYKAEYEISLRLHGALWDKVTPEMQMLRETAPRPSESSLGLTHSYLHPDSDYTDVFAELETFGIQLRLVSNGPPWTSFVTLYTSVYW